jgi:hypothetical protein
VIREDGHEHSSLSPEPHWERKHTTLYSINKMLPP